MPRPVATYSIVARDEDSGRIGAAVQSHWFAVGSIVLWAEAGVGAVVTQALVDPSYGPLGLELMRAGRSAPSALKSLIADDSASAVRQVGMIDARGRPAAHTGSRCVAEAGHVVDRDYQFCVQANMMAADTVWTAMADAFRDTEGELVDRLLAALDAAEAAGGDIRGRQSAAMVIVAPENTGRPWADREVDLRVDDHPEPLRELRRLAKLQAAYCHMNSGDAAIERGRFDEAERQYRAASMLAPRIVEIPFWHAVALASAGRVDEALPIFRDVFEREPIWREFIPRLVRSQMLPGGDVVERILAT